MKTVKKIGLLIWGFLILFIGFNASAAYNPYPWYVEYDGMGFAIGPWLDEEIPLCASVWSHRVGNEWHSYEGDIVIPDTVRDQGNVYPVKMIERGLCGSELTSLYVPNTVEELGEGALAYTRGLDSINLPATIRMHDRAFEFSEINKFYFRENSTPSLYNALGLSIDKTEKCEIIDIESVSLILFHRSPTKRLNIHHCDSIVITNHFLSRVDYVVMDDSIPPKYSKDYFSSKGNPEEKGYTVRSLLFVPDEAVEAYESAYFWRCFQAVYPKSRLDEVEQLLSSSINEVGIPDTEPLDVRIEGRSIRVEGTYGNPCRIFDIHGRLIRILTDGTTESYLIPGVYIVSCGDRRTKVVIR